MPEPTAPLFTPAARTESRSSLLPIGIAVAVIALVLGAFLLVSSRHHAVNPNQPQPLAAYAGNLALSQLAMSESTSLSGGKSTFLDGHVTNKGSQTVTGIAVQVFFKNDEGMPPHLETVPVTLIRTRQPYIDTEPVSADPIKPGDDREFRLIFESIPDNWNTQLPDIHITAVSLR